ncbi:hypothetical protein RHGRI_012041 [Rhododendron griersonianum]|uniref:Endonuclease/exonuclease/phosphatase domain-containing protein n=1 Tax=Rhododendron griersonianum TaxID=479676 RepID=A0AAV6KP55_9ERIC|nr:hypothetical protein RHGRI_012041 [Rhododendron griersonianum]
MHDMQNVSPTQPASISSLLTSNSVQNSSPGKSLSGRLVSPTQSSHFLPFIQRHPDHVWGFWEEALGEAWENISPYYPTLVPPSPHPQVVVTFLSAPYTFSGDLPPQTIQLNQIYNPVTWFLPNNTLYQDQIHVETLLPLTLPPKMEFHCLEDIPRVFQIPGQLNVAHLLTASKTPNQLFVSVESSNQPGFAAPLHLVMLNPLYLDPVSKAEMPCQSVEVLNQPPLIPTNLPMKILMWNSRGAANPHFRRHFADMVREHNPTFVIIMETQIAGPRAKRLSEELGFTNSFVADAPLMEDLPIRRREEEREEPRRRRVDWRKSKSNVRRNKDTTSCW